MALELLLFFSIFFAAAFFWPTYRLWRRERINALVLPYDDSAHGMVGRWFRVTLIGMSLFLAALALGLPPAAAGPLPWLEQPVVRNIGWGLLALSLVWVVAAQAQMGASWRIGIDAGTRLPLVTTGIFALSRNPIFLGMRGSLLGLFLVLPNAFTLAILLVGEVLIQVQVRLEEAHLLASHGPQYEAYRQSVRRWI
ncbi:methyltransferase family protein [Tsuneonella aeria]|nr:isoprenylcysteine carboxylmethyltransferase family protein [Tsuneonella aeria]